jgi:hypothetical protein
MKDIGMELDDFVLALAESAPSIADLEKCGLSKEQALDFAKSFLCVKRERPWPVVSGSNQLLELLRRWDLRKVEIGMVRFPDPPTEQLGYVCVGRVEVDPLVILPGTEEIAVHELGSKEHLLWLVAKSGSTLLDALIVAARFLAQRTVGTIDFDNFKAARLVATECATVAAGEKYSDFYKMLLGAQ